MYIFVIPIMFIFQSKGKHFEYSYNFYNYYSYNQRVNILSILTIISVHTKLNGRTEA